MSRMYYCCIRAGCRYTGLLLWCCRCYISSCFLSGNGVHAACVDRKTKTKKPKMRTAINILRSIHHQQKRKSTTAQSDLTLDAPTKPPGVYTALASHPVANSLTLLLLLLLFFRAPHVRGSADLSSCATRSTAVVQ